MSRSNTHRISISPAETSQSPSTDASYSCRALLTAIVRRAILDFVVYQDTDEESSPENFELFVDAAGWLFFDGTETVDENGGYTFCFICSVLELDPQSLRREVLSMTRDDVPRFNGSMG